MISAFAILDNVHFGFQAGAIRKAGHGYSAYLHQEIEVLVRIYSRVWHALTSSALSVQLRTMVGCRRQVRKVPIDFKIMTNCGLILLVIGVAVRHSYQNPGRLFSFEIRTAGVYECNYLSLWSQKLEVLK